MFERRQCIRLGCEIPSKFRMLGRDNVQRFTAAVVRDISRAGVRVLTDSFIPLQTQLYFYLDLPRHETIETRLAPAWIAELPHIGKFEMGARFVELPPNQEDVIQSYQYRALLDRIPPHAESMKDFQSSPKDSGQVA